MSSGLSSSLRSLLLPKNRWPQNARTEMLFIERAQLVLRNGPTSLVVHVVLGLMLVSVLSGRTPDKPLMIWLAVLIAVTALRGLLLFFFRSRPSQLSLSSWVTLYSMGSTAAGLCWGLSIFCVGPHPDLVTAVILTFALGGLSVGGFAAMGSMLRVYVPFLLALIVPIAVHFLWLRPEPGMSALGLMLIAFICAMIGLAGTQRTVISRALTLAVDLAEAKEKVEATSRAKSDFLAYISHEIRTPMSGVLGMAELLFDSHLDSDQRRLANTIVDSGKSLLAVINDVLDLSKIEAGKLTLERQPFDPVQVIANQVALFREQAQRKQLTLNTEVSPEVPRWVLGDQQRFGQIIANLLSNAVKFTESGGVELQLCTQPAVAVDAIELVLSVRDSGAGIAPTELERIFESYEQSNISTAHKFGGSGLGLAICKNLAEMMHGTVAAQSQLGQGSVFTLQIQVGVAVDTDGHVPRAEVQTAPTSRRLRGRVLIAEDNVVNQELIARMLKSFGCTLVVVDNGVAAVELAQQQAWDLILMDGNMPLLGGVEAAQAIRRWECDMQRAAVPIIAVTANAMMEDRRRYMEAGMNGCLIKPFSRQQLFDVLCVHLSVDVDSH